MPRFITATLLVAIAAPLAASEQHAYVAPVVTAKVKDRIYTTTLALRNEGTEDVECEAIYAIPNDPKGGTLRSRYTVPHGGRPHVEEDVLMEVGAVGTMRIVCSGRLAIAARIQASLDGGTTFDEGRTFAGLDEGASFKRLRTMKVTSDLLVAEVAGRPVKFEAIVKNDPGAIIGRKTYGSGVRATDCQPLQTAGNGQRYSTSRSMSSEAMGVRSSPAARRATRSC